MSTLRFSWDPRKARVNHEKHGVSFDEAQGVFFDEHAILTEDPDASGHEQRFLILGLKCWLSPPGGVSLRSGDGKQHSHHQRASCAPGGATAVLGKAEAMRKKYDFSKGRKNPYAKRLKKQITIRIDEPTIEYFKQVSEGTGIPYQTLINLYLRDCAQQGRRLSLEWQASA